MKAFLLVTFLPLLLLAALLSFGTRKGSDWERNLLSEAKTTGTDEWLSSLSPRESKLLQDFRGEWGKHGLILQPGVSGFATFDLSSAPGSNSLRIRVWAYDHGGCSVKWWPKEGRGSPVTLSGEGSLNGKIYRIELPAATSQIILEVSGRNDTAQPQVLVHRIAMSSSPFKPVKGWIAVLWCWGILTALWLGVAAKRKWWSPPGGMKLWYAALFLLLVGGSLRLNLLSFQNGVRLDPDVIMYQIFAERFEWFDTGRGFYSASFSEREPLWIAMLNLWQRWVGAGPLSARLLTCVLSVAVIAFSGILLWRFLGKRGWVIAGMSLVALNPALVEESCRGLRSETMTLGFVGFLLLTFHEKEGRFSPIKAGLLGGTWALVQSPALGIVFGTWLVLWLVSLVANRASLGLIIPKGYSLPKVLLAMSISLALFIPHLYGLQKRHGDWRWPSYGYARWNANVEFPERLGTPGFPTVEEFNKSPYAGPRISYGEYLFGLHTPSQLVKYQILGWVELTAYQILSFCAQSLKRLMFSISGGTFSFLGILTSIGPALVLGFLLGIVSLVAWFRLLLDKRYWWMPLMLLWGTYYVAFLYHVRLVEPLRHTMHTYPLLVLITTWGAQWLWDRFRISEITRHVWTGRLQKQEPV
jgi:hypothetical protein